MAETRDGQAIYNISILKSSQEHFINASMGHQNQISQYFFLPQSLNVDIVKISSG